MEKDTSLGLAGKFFLEDAKIKAGDTEKRSIPNSIHLVRRADYLTHCLREYHQGLSSTKKSSVGSKGPKSRVSAQDAGSSSSKASSSKRPSDSKPSSHSKPSSNTKPSSKQSSTPKVVPAKRRATPDYSSSDDGSVYESMDEGDCKEILRPVKKELKRLKSGLQALPKEEKLIGLKECLTAIGARIEEKAASEKSGEAKDKRRKHLCEYSLPSSTFLVLY